MLATAARRLLVVLVIALAALPAGAAPVARWTLDGTLDGTAVDDVGGIAGTLLGTAEFVAGGVAGGALRLGYGGGGAVDMGPVLAFGDHDFSLALWVRTEPGATAAMYPVAKHASGYGGYLVGLNTDGVYGQAGKAWFYDVGSPGQQAFSTTDVNDGQWHHLVCVYRTGGFLAIFVDGAPREGWQPAPPNPVTGARFLLGGLDVYGTPTAYYQGLIDEVQVYDHALDADDVVFLHEHPGALAADRDIPVTAGLRMWLRADAAGDAGDQEPVLQWPDRSGQGLHVYQVDPGALPRYVADAYHGQPAVRFDGTDAMQRDGVPGSQITSAEGATIFLLARQAGSDQYNTAFGWGYGGNRLYVHYTWEDWLVLQHGAPSPAGGPGSWPQPAGWDDAFHLVELTRDGAVFRCAIDGVDQGDQVASDTPDLGVPQSLLIGSDAYSVNNFTGDICEIAVYDRALTPHELNAVRVYLADRYDAPAVGVVETPPPLGPRLSLAPNPFNPATTIRFETAVTGPVELAVFDLAGRRVTTLIAGARNAGRHEVRWDGRDAGGRLAGAGVYLMRLVSPDGVAAQRAVLVK